MTLRPDRRSLLRLAALAPAFALPGFAFPAPLRAAVGTVEGGDTGTFFRFSVGSLRVTVVTDGPLTLPTTFLGVNADRAEVVAFLEALYQPADTTTAFQNAVVVDSGTSRVLIDTGCSVYFQPTAGRLFASLAAAGIAPDSITHVAVTHLHPDHFWGLLDAAGAPLLGSTPILTGAAELGFWSAEGLASQMPAEMRDMVNMTQRVIGLVKPRLQPMADGAEIVPGLRFIPTPGHTPGHVSVRLESEGQALIVTGDAVTHPYISFERPGWAFGFDAQPDVAVASRRALLDMAAAERVPVLGYHFPFPGVGHVVKQGDAFRYLPAMWQPA